MGQEAPQALDPMQQPMLGSGNLAVGGYGIRPGEVGQPQRPTQHDSVGEEGKIDVAGLSPGGGQFLDEGEQQRIQ